MLESDCRLCGKVIRLTSKNVHWVSDETQWPEVCAFDSVGLDIRHEPGELREL